MKEICRNCKIEFNLFPSRKGKKFYCSMECYLPQRIENILKVGEASRFTKEKPFLGDKHQPKGEKHHAWKKKPGYRGLHYWVRREKGEPESCVNCNEKATDWANISGDYKRDTNDYQPMCRTCHKRFDMKILV
jgi:hypothetical protein